MAEIYYPNPGVTQRQHEYLLGGAYASGVSGHPEDQPVVYANGTGTREVRIRANRRAVVEGYGWENDAAEIVKTLGANSSGSTRIDLVVLRLNRTDYSVTVQVVQGTPGAGAPTPSYDGDLTGPWELPLAEVTVASGATSLASSTVKNRAWYIGSDGQIRCTKDTLPPGEAGRTVWLHPEGRYLVSNGPSWAAVWDDSGVLSVQILPNFAATENSLQRRAGVCVLNLKVQRTNAAFPAGSVTKVAALPDGFAPTFPVQPAALAWSSGQPAALRVTPSGVYVVTAAGVSVPEDRTVEGSAVWHAA